MTSWIFVYIVHHWNLPLSTKAVSVPLFTHCCIWNAGIIPVSKRALSHSLGNEEMNVSALLQPHLSLVPPFLPQEADNHGPLIL